MILLSSLGQTDHFALGILPVSLTCFTRFKFIAYSELYGTLPYHSTSHDDALVWIFCDIRLIDGVSHDDIECVHKIAMVCITSCRCLGMGFHKP